MNWQAFERRRKWPIGRGLVGERGRVMNEWIWGACAVFWLYFAAAKIWDARGALACFAVTPVIWLTLFCTIWRSGTDFWGRKWKMDDLVYSVTFATGFGTVLTWFVGLIAVAIALGLTRKMKGKIY